MDLNFCSMCYSEAMVDYLGDCYYNSKFYKMFVHGKICLHSLFFSF